MGKPRGPNGIVFEWLLPDPITRVWDHLTKPELLSGWLSEGTVEPCVGGRFELRFDEIGEHWQRGRVTRWEPPRALAYTWHEGGEVTSHVTFELEQVGEGARVRLTHERLPDGETPDYGAGWHAHLDALQLLLATGKRDTRQEHSAAYKEIRPRYAGIVTA